MSERRQCGCSASETILRIEEYRRLVDDIVQNPGLLGESERKTTLELSEKHYLREASDALDQLKSTCEVDVEGLKHDLKGVHLALESTKILKAYELIVDVRSTFRKNMCGIEQL